MTETELGGSGASLWRLRAAPAHPCIAFRVYLRNNSERPSPRPKSSEFDSAAKFVPLFFSTDGRIVYVAVFVVIDCYCVG
jgi:hypothetical protein